MTCGCRAARDPATLKALTTINPSQSTASYDSTKLGIDAHAQYYWVSRQVDGATPQPVQKLLFLRVSPNYPGVRRTQKTSLRLTLGGAPDRCPVLFEAPSLLPLEEGIIGLALPGWRFSGQRLYTNSDGRPIAQLSGIDKQGVGSH